MGHKLAAYDAQGNVTGFYDDVDSPIPSEKKGVEITDEQWKMLLDGQARGKRMVLDTSLMPILLDPLPLSRDAVIALNTATRDDLLRQASVALSPLQMAISFGEATEDETAVAKTWVAFSRAVKAVDLTKAGPVWPALPTIA